ncbi:hypothetical protein [Xenorhabdus bovienii]|uniref:hypothetical protein n=1 Tax=Xenorhabdus bovienii TaxID=40576 RepID=UPI003DA57F5F
MKQATHSVNIGKDYAVDKAAFLLSKPVNFSQSTEIERRDMSEQIEKKVENLESDVAQLKTDVAVIKSNYATKADIESVKVLVHNEISSVKSIIHNEVSQIYKKIADQTKWIMTMMVGFSGIIIAAMKYML